MAKGGEQPTQKTEPVYSPQQQELMGLAMPGLRQWAANPLTRYQGETIANFTPEQLQAQQMAMGAAGRQGSEAADVANRMGFYTGGDIWNPQTNQYLQGAIDAATRPVQENMDRALAGRNVEAASTGNFGSSRVARERSNIVRDASREMGDQASKLVQAQYDTNMRSQLQAMGMLPMLQQAELAPAMTISGVGDARQAREQALLDRAQANYYYDQNAPFMQSAELMGLLNSMPTGSQSTANNPANNPWRSALGGAMAGGSLGSMFGPWGAGAGALAGGAGGYFFA